MSPITLPTLSSANKSSIPYPRASLSERIRYADNHTYSLGVCTLASVAIRYVVKRRARTDGAANIFGANHRRIVDT